ELDRIEEGDTPWVDTVRAFYKRFAQDLRRASGKMENLKRGTETGQACPTCGQPLLERWGRFGRFLACSAYPECRFTQNLGGHGPVAEPCPKCGAPFLTERLAKGRKMIRECIREQCGYKLEAEQAVT